MFVNGHKNEPELKRPGNGASCGYEGVSEWHGPIYNKMLEEG